MSDELFVLLLMCGFVIGSGIVLMKFLKYLAKAVKAAHCRYRLKGKVENAVVSCGGPGWTDCKTRLCYTYRDRYYKVVIKNAPKPLKIGDEVDVFIDPDYPTNYWIPSDEELAQLDK